MRKALLLILPIGKIRGCDHFLLKTAACRIRWLAFPQHHQAFRLRKGQWLEQYSVDNAENCRVRADAQAERENCDYREAGLFSQHSRAVAQVLPQCLHTASSEEVVSG